MLVIKGFAQHIKFTNNQKEVINPFGEISNHALTYAKDVGHYAFDDNNDITLHTFSTKLNGNYQELSLAQKNHLFSVINWVYEKVLTRTRLYQDELGNNLITRFAATFENIKVGEIVDNDGYYCPEWVSFNFKNPAASLVRIFFSDQAFRRRFDEFEVLAVPAIANVDDFLKTPKEVKAKIDAETIETFSDRIEKVRGKKPDTVTRLLSFDWIDRTDPTNKIKTSWATIIYGGAGDNIDAQKEALANYILANSQSNRDVWKEVFPDIFKRTEFTFVPQWNKYAIPNRSIVEGIYSPVVQVTNLATTLKPYFHEYTQTHVNAQIATMSHTYRSLSLVVCSNHENRDRKFKITDVYPDYIAVNSLSQDWNRMSEATRDWSEILSELIIHAESMTEYTEIPEGYYRLKRNGKIYIGRAVDNIQYLVACKANFTPAT